MNASRPVLNEDGRIRIREGRHPLLNAKTVVPITVSLGEDFTLLIITGPNTGRPKQCLSRPWGFFTLMGQAGPSHPRRGPLGACRLPAGIHADIGDEQSIEQSLSTFSSHMTNIVSFLKKGRRTVTRPVRRTRRRYRPDRGRRAGGLRSCPTFTRGAYARWPPTHYSELKVYAPLHPE